MNASQCLDPVIERPATQGCASDASLATQTRARPAPEQLFIEHMALISHVIKAVAWRHRLSSTEHDEFASTVWMRLIEDDYRVLREFRHECSLRTFLGVVVLRMYLDFRNYQWGKWRPSAEAKRQGKTAILLERLLGRDGLTFEEAVETLHTQHDVTASRDTLWELARRLRIRRPAPRTTTEPLPDYPDPAPLPDAIIARRQRRGDTSRARHALRRAVMTLETDDQELIRLRFHNGLRVVDIARTLKVHQKPLYRRFEQVLVRLRRTLERDRAVADLVRSSLQEDWREIETCER
jgi:RNA polymerase sigma factor (sigma-70 family)